MAELTRDAVLRSLADHLVAGLDWQITDPGHADHGGIVRPEWGIAQAGGAVGWLAGCALVLRAVTLLGFAFHLPHDVVHLLRPLLRLTPDRPRGRAASEGQMIDSG